MKITIYTDGSSRGNPGPGGWGCVLITEHKKEGEGSMEQEGYEEEVIELGGSEKVTTNNRMELSGALFGLKEIDAKRGGVKEVEVCTDSQYVKKGMTEWIDGWIKNGWKSSTKKPVLNQDLWEALKKEEERLQKRGIKVLWKYVPGHAGVSLNERADVIATSYADSIINNGATNLQLYRGSKKDYTLTI